MERAAAEKAENRRIGRPHRQLFRSRPTAGVDRGGHRLVSGRSVQGVVDYRVGAGGHLSVFAIAGDADCPDRCCRGLAKDGLLVTRGHAIETLARATHFVFDKTGTLTTGRMHLVDLLPTADLPRDECLAIAAALERASEHPLASALRRAFDGPIAGRR